MNILRKVRAYPVTTSLVLVNIYTYYNRQVDGLKKAKKKFTIEKLESFIKRDEIPNSKDLIKNFTHFNCSLSNMSLGINLAALLIIGRNLEMLYGSRMMIVIELSNYFLHFMSFYFSRMTQLDLFFIKNPLDNPPALYFCN